MEYVAGCTLRDVLRERGALRPRAALDILEPVLAALGAAHRAGFVHRDMKPENVLIGDDGRVKVADFGLVRAVDTGHQHHRRGARHRRLSRPRADRAAARPTPASTCTPAGSCCTRCSPATSRTTGTPPPGALQAPPRGRPAAVGRRARACRSSWTSWSPAPPPATPDLRPRRRGGAARAGARGARRRYRRAAGRAAPAGASPPGTTSPRTAQRDPALADGAAAAAGRRGRRPAARGATAPAGWRARRPPPPGGAGLRGGPRRGLARARRRRAAGARASARASGTSTPASSPRSRRVLAKTEAQARKRLEEAGLEVGKVEHALQRHRQARHGHRHRPRRPARGSASNGSVTLTVSDGPEMVKVPDVAGARAGEAEARLRGRRAWSRAWSPGVQRRRRRGRGDRHRPGGRAPQRHAGSAVALVVSKGSPVDVPDVTGEDLDDATADAGGGRAEGEASPPQQVNSEYDKGKVARQTPGRAARRPRATR